MQNPLQPGNSERNPSCDEDTLKDQRRQELRHARQNVEFAVASSLDFNSIETETPVVTYGIDENFTPKLKTAPGSDNSLLEPSNGYDPSISLNFAREQVDQSFDELGL